MSLPVILRPAADTDIQATHDELEQLQAGLGDRFVARAREVLERILCAAEAEELCDRIAATGALDGAREEALRHVRAAKSLLEQLELGERQRTTLDLVADSVVERYA